MTGRRQITQIEALSRWTNNWNEQTNKHTNCSPVRSFVRKNGLFLLVCTFEDNYLQTNKQTNFYRNKSTNKQTSACAMCTALAMSMQSQKVIDLVEKNWNHSHLASLPSSYRASDSRFFYEGKCWRIWIVYLFWRIWFISWICSRKKPKIALINFLSVSWFTKMQEDWLPWDKAYDKKKKTKLINR